MLIFKVCVSSFNCKIDKLIFILVKIEIELKGDQLFVLNNLKQNKSVESNTL